MDPERITTTTCQIFRRSTTQPSAETRAVQLSDSRARSIPTASLHQILLTTQTRTTSSSHQQKRTHGTAKQNAIDADHKINADYVDDSTSTNKFVTASDKERNEAERKTTVTSSVLILLTTQPHEQVRNIKSRPGTQSRMQLMQIINFQVRWPFAAARDSKVGRSYQTNKFCQTGERIILNVFCSTGSYNDTTSGTPM